MRKIKLKFLQMKEFFVMSKALADMLGFNSEGPYTQIGKHYADHVI